MNKLVSMQEALGKIQDQDTVMIAGFTNFGAPNNMINALKDTDLQGLTTISEDLGWSNDRFQQGVSALISAGKVQKVTTLRHFWVRIRSLTRRLLPVNWKLS